MISYINDLDRPVHVHTLIIMHLAVALQKLGISKLFVETVIANLLRYGPYIDVMLQHP